MLPLLLKEPKPIRKINTCFLFWYPIKELFLKVSAEGKYVGIIIHFLRDAFRANYLPFHDNQKMLAAALHL